MKLVWHATGLWERDWFLYILGDLVDGEINDVKLTCFDDETIHIISSNWTPLPECIPYFRQLRSRCKHIVMIHIADEWFSGGYRAYQYFDLVLRVYHTHLASAPGIVTIPLGYPYDTGSSLRPVDRRQYAWSFAGAIKSSRIAMAKALEGFEPHLLFDTLTNPQPLNKADFNTILEDTVFSPCPMGNAIIDTWRLYESLELGCIPLVESRISLDYYTDLLGPNPIPAFRSWSAARQFAESAYRDESLLSAKQTEISQWWQAYKARLCADLHAAITGPSHMSDLQAYAAKLRNRVTLVHEPLRIRELLRHQTGGSLLRRLAKTRGPLTRIIADLSGGKLTTAGSVTEARAARQRARALIQGLEQHPNSS